jgi:hypothetical protein
MHARLVLSGMLSVLTLAMPASACINEYGRPTRPHKPRPERPAEFMAHLRDRSEHDAIVSGPPPVEPGPDADFKARSDYAARLVRRGESRKAVEILEAVEQSHPGEYIVAANLGTAYELSGDLVKAHGWISEGIRRNPDAHDGTEWLHLQILGARQALSGDPRWLQSNSVTGLDFGADAQPRKPERWPKESGGPEGVITALFYQLHERMAFVPPPDPLVGSMIAELANLLMLYRSAELAIPVYDLALSYRPAKLEQVTARKMRTEEIRQDELDSDWKLQRTMIGLAAFTIAAALLLRLRRGR